MFLPLFQTQDPDSEKEHKKSIKKTVYTIWPWSRVCRLRLQKALCSDPVPTLPKGV